MEININENVCKLRVEDGDVVIVTMPEGRHPNRMYESVYNQFKEILKDKKVEVAVIPHGMQVQYYKGSMMEDK